MKNRKQLLLDYCNTHIQTKIQEVDLSLKLLQDAAENETKSSMGDKYETSRSMLQQENDKLLTQRVELQKQQQVLSKIATTPSQKIALGALVHTSIGTFYLAIGLGRRTIENDNYFIVGLQSPIVLAMQTATVNQPFSFNNQNITILTIE